MISERIAYYICISSITLVYIKIQRYILYCKYQFTKNHIWLLIPILQKLSIFVSMPRYIKFVFVVVVYRIQKEN